MLQYITNTECGHSVEDQIKAVWAGGCRWIQIRMKDASDDEIRSVVNNVRGSIPEQDTFLLLDDRVELCRELELTGVHLGREDMKPAQARSILGPLAVIGVTANTIEDVEAVSDLDIDYFGLGPFAMTTTKKNLAPVLGIEGIRNLCGKMDEAGVEIPIVAVGGIREEDIAPLLAAGVNGIAVSGEIAFAKDMEAATARLMKLCNPK